MKLDMEIDELRHLNLLIQASCDKGCPLCDGIHTKVLDAIVLWEEGGITKKEVPDYLKKLGVTDIEIEHPAHMPKIDDSGECTECEDEMTHD